MRKVVIYARVSTAEQGLSGLGIDSQLVACRRVALDRGWKVIAEFTEVASGRLYDDGRPRFAAAVKRARLGRAEILAADDERIGRNRVTMGELERAGVRYITADMPDAPEIVQDVKQWQAREFLRRNSERTKMALAALKAKGVTLGNPNGAAALRRIPGQGTAASAKVRSKLADNYAEDLREDVERLQSAGNVSHRAIAKALNDANLTTRRGGEWSGPTVAGLLRRLAANKAS